MDHPTTTGAPVGADNFGAVAGLAVRHFCISRRAILRLATWAIPSLFLASAFLFFFPSETLAFFTLWQETNYHYDIGGASGYPQFQLPLADNTSTPVSQIQLYFKLSGIRSPAGNLFLQFTCKDSGGSSHFWNSYQDSPKILTDDWQLLFFSVTSTPASCVYDIAGGVANAGNSVNMKANTENGEVSEGYYSTNDPTGAVLGGGQVSLDFSDNPPHIGTTANVAFYQPITWGGNCPINGDNELALSFGHANGSIDNWNDSAKTPPDTYVGPFYINCINNKWQNITGVGIDTVAAFILDKNDPADLSHSLAIYASADGRPYSGLSWDSVMTHSPETNDFTDWLLHYSYGAGMTATSTQVCVDYGPSASSTFAYQDCGYFFDPHDHIAENVDIPKATDLPMGNYKAVGFWTDQNTLLTLASTTELDFSVVFSHTDKPPTTFPNGQEPVGLAAIGTPESSKPECNNSNVIANGFCKVLVYLFQPTQGSLNMFPNLWDTIKQKPPFGWFSGSISELTATLGSATSTPSNFHINEVSGFAALFAYLKAGLAWLLWFVWIIAIIKMFHNLDF